MIGGRQLTFRPAQTACAAVRPGYAPGSTGPQTRTSSSPTTGMPPTLAFATRRADVEEADSAEAVALLWTLSEQTDCAATSELGEVGVPNYTGLLHPRLRG